LILNRYMGIELHRAGLVFKDAPNSFCAGQVRV